MITIGIIPPKRPFAHTQILSYIDGHQKLGATIKFGAFSEPFTHCTIGVAYQKIRRPSNNEKEPEKLQTSSSIDSATGTPKGMFPSLMERAFLPQIVSQVSYPFVSKLIGNLIEVTHPKLIFSGAKLFFVTVAKYIIE